MGHWLEVTHAAVSSFSTQACWWPLENDAKDYKNGWEYVASGPCAVVDLTKAEGKSLATVTCPAFVRLLKVSDPVRIRRGHGVLRIAHCSQLSFLGLGLLWHR